MACDRFDRDGWIDDDDLDAEARAHVESCAECRANLEANRKLAGDLSRLSDRHALSASASERLWAAVERGETPPRAPSRLRKAAAVALPLALAAGLLVAFLLRAPVTVSLEYRVRAGDGVVRSGDAAAGERLQVEAQSGAANHDLRVYRDRSLLVARCPGAGDCWADGHTTTLELRFDTPGTYEILWLSSAASIPAPSGSVDGDVADAVEAGARYELRELRVR